MSGCQLTMTHLTKDGYGRVRLGKQMVLAHRLAWALHNGADPADKVVMHACDNRACLNPEHLVLGTQKENIQDCVNKRRNRGGVGERNVKAKLAPGDVFEIRSMGPDADIACTAARYGICEQSVRNVIGRVTWGHL